MARMALSREDSGGIRAATSGIPAPCGTVAAAAGRLPTVVILICDKAGVVRYECNDCGAQQTMRRFTSRPITGRTREEPEEGQWLQCGICGRTGACWRPGRRSRRRRLQRFQGSFDFFYAAAGPRRWASTPPPIPSAVSPAAISVGRARRRWNSSSTSGETIPSTTSAAPSGVTASSPTSTGGANATCTRRGFGNGPRKSALRPR